VPFREDNGVYHIAMLLLPARVTGAPPGSTPPPAKVELQRHAFRALRFLFSLERNRRLFKRLFTAELFDLFLRVEHYKIDLRLYYTMVNFVNAMTRQVR
jgi:NIMA (never in mitosis gene a)-related kinase